MKKTIITVLVVILVVAVLAAAAALGLAWYINNHIFVDKIAYPVNAETLDLREEDISLSHYDSLHAQLPNCEILWMVPFQETHYPSDSKSLVLTKLSQEDMDMLPYFPYLEEITAQFHDYPMLEALKEQYPALTVHYDVSLGSKTYAPDTTELILENGDYEYDALLENLKYLPNVTAVTLKMPQLTLEQVETLQSTYEGIAFSCTVDILGQEYDNQITELDLSAMTSADVAAIGDKLGMLPNMARVELMNADGTSLLTLEDVKLLQTAAPHVVFNYTFEFYGKTLSTADEEVHIHGKRIGDAGVDEVRKALDVMKNCKRFVLEYCSISNEVLAQLREEYRDQTKVVWRIFFGGGSTMTDAEIIRCTYDLDDDNCHDLVYCEDVRFIDFGHNEFLDNCDFVAGMPNLEYIILSGAPIKSLEAFRNCKKLKFLEIAFCEYIEDLSPLADCESLQMLNIGNTHATDLSPLDNLSLTHFGARCYPSGKSRVPQEEQDRFLAQHPSCWTAFTGAQPYGVGWRYGEDEITPLPQYALVQAAFQLPHPPNNTGWYLSEELLAQITATEAAIAEAVSERAAAAQAAAAETTPEEAASETIPGETVPEETVTETTEDTPA